jgi:hypothetical protein
MRRGLWRHAPRAALAVAAVAAVAPVAAAMAAAAAVERAVSAAPTAVVVVVVAAAAAVADTENAWSNKKAPSLASGGAFFMPRPQRGIKVARTRPLSSTTRERWS